VAKNTQTAQSNVVALPKRDEAPTQALAEQTPGMTTGQKVGVGAGIVGVTGLAGFGLYKLGVRMGWWGVSPIIIDDPQDGGGGETQDNSRPIEGGGGGSSGARASGNPPNYTGDSNGYNTKLFPEPSAVRLALREIGYRVEYNNETLVPDNRPNAEVKRFQNEWNKVIRGIDSGKIKLPLTPSQPVMVKGLRGLLVADGIPGKNTLNALEIAVNNQVQNQLKWTSLVGQA
jgi:hypothetical protein